jgi:anti-sigma factor RsiW
MSCQEARQLIDAYVDQELDLVRSLDFDRHLEDCAECRALREEVEELGSALRTHTPYFAAPDGLEKRIRAQLRPPAAGQTRTVRRHTWLEWRPFAVACSVVGLAIFSVIFVMTLRRSAETDTLAQQVVSSHIRSLMANHLADVPSSDQHTVKPWFNGKLDFSPPVKDFKTVGFPLTGGRLDYLDGRPIAALLYQRNRHIINLFVWPSSHSDSGPQASILKGYNIIHWTRSGMTYWAVSDLNAAELNEFVRDQRQ